MNAALSRAVVALYAARPLRPALRRFVNRLDGGEMFSPTLRRIFAKYYSVSIGQYSYGSCFAPGVLPPGTTVGNYSSFAEGLVVLRRNHPLNWLSQHPLFFNASCGLLREDAIPGIKSNPLRVGHDVWIGSRVLILPKCTEIASGAVVGAGAVVTRNVPPFAVVAGNPARVLAMRFPANVIEGIQEVRWWEHSLSVVGSHASHFMSAVDISSVTRFREAIRFSGANSSPMPGGPHRRDSNANDPV